MLTMINGIEGLKARAGEDLGVSDWYDVTQAGIDAFADATGTTTSGSTSIPSGPTREPCGRSHRPAATGSGPPRARRS